MTRQEFMEQLKRALASSLTSEEVAEYLVYYQDYIDSQMRNGMSEGEVLNSLGSAKLIAKSILEARRMKGQTTEDYTTYDRDEDVHQSRKAGTNDFVKSFIGMPTWLAVVIFVVVIGLVFSLVTSLISFLMPIFLPILCILLIYQIFKNHMR